MNAPLYTMEILRLAASIPYQERLANPGGSAEKRSPVCGSRVAVDAHVDAGGRVAEIGMLVCACAFGQASAALMGKAVIGRTPAEIAAARDELARWLAGARETPPDWPGMNLLAPALPHRGRHPSIRLAFEAAADAAAQAEARA